MGLIVTLAGLAIMVAGLVTLFGAPAAVACGLVLAVAGLVVDWERVAR
jgi:hypothetical protein